MRLRRFLFSTLCALPLWGAYAQDKAPENWFNLDKEKDKVMGVSSERAYEELLKGKQPKKKIIVAIIDSGVEADHEDLKEVMWVNEKEIPGNGIDDDGNGYVDDIYGWNFIGGKDGRNVNHDTYELTRLYAMLRAKTKRSKAEEKLYEEVKTTHKKKVSEMKMQQMSFQAILDADKTLVEHFGKEKYTLEEVSAINTEDKKVKDAQTLIRSVLKSYEVEQIREYGNYFNNALNYGYNLDFSPRDIVGDNYENVKERYYGNNDVEGPDAEHGTHVAGIVAANRANNQGMKGVADYVRIMAVRAVPNGDERDKDIANAIRYAVDNGADIINMSFGKRYTLNKKIVDEAMQYAEKKGVLLVHAAGNNAENNDEVEHYPSKRYGHALKGKKQVKTWIEVGALSWKPGADSPAEFSNYGAKSVDLFSPGVDIYSTVPNNGYKANSGTSMAAPALSGVAALVWAYYPELTAVQLKEILMQSCVKLDFSVKKPGSGKMVPFAELCISSGVVNAYKALQLAEKTPGKRKLK